MKITPPQVLSAGLWEFMCRAKLSDALGDAGSAEIDVGFWTAVGAGGLLLVCQALLLKQCVGGRAGSFETTLLEEDEWAINEGAYDPYEPPPEHAAQHKQSWEAGEANTAW